MIDGYTEAGRIYHCEIKTKHLHALGQERQVDPDVWHDGLYNIPAVDYWGRPDSMSEQWAIDLQNDLIELGYPAEDIRIHLEIHYERNCP